MNKQVIFCNGGVPKENFDNYYEYLKIKEYNPYEVPFLNYSKTLGEALGEGYEYLRAPFENREYADYEAWKIMFEKMSEYFHDEIILGGTSLGACFLLKYIGENDGIINIKTGKKVRIKKLFLLAAAIEETVGGSESTLGSFAFNLENSYSRVQRWCEKIYIYHSTDDHVVPFAQSLKLKQYFPTATFREFTDLGHFYQLESFPELISDITHDSYNADILS